MIAGLGAQLYRDADALLARSGSTFARAAVTPATSRDAPVDLPGAAAATVDAKTLGGLGAALIGAERTLDRSLLDLFA